MCVNECECECYALYSEVILSFELRIVVFVCILDLKIIFILKLYECDECDVQSILHSNETELIYN